MRTATSPIFLPRRNASRPRWRIAAIGWLAAAAAWADCDRPRWNSYNQDHFRQDWVEQHGNRTPYSCRLIEDPTVLHREHIVPWRQIRDDSPSCQIAQIRYQAGINLTVAFADVNLEKGSRDIAEWQPAHNVCWFAERIRQVKARWTLSYRASELRAQRGILANCSEFEKSNLVCPEDSDELLEQMQRPTRWRWLYQRGAAGENARPQREAAAQQREAAAP